ncbi:DUF5677 domain-containing protein [Paenibacillus sp. GbtcB18]|uniref:DUF5677 domain-containing protein n=1 Tax=Paenibacillus sp. GbtcB18 TaxID=2824763 RepID=UPI001C3074A4|nr:DUF5677 domain-containing protein [Paenibacillus sp. GbtcB18]
MKQNELSLSQEWLLELGLIKDNDNFVHLSRHISVLHTCDVIIDTLQQKKLNPFRLGSLKVISAFYFAHTYHQALSIYHLSKLGLGASGLVLVRSIIESLINLSYLWQCKSINNTEEERKAWMDYMHVSRHKMENAWDNMQKHRRSKQLDLGSPEYLFSEKVSSNLSNEYKQFKLKYKRESWAIFSKIEQRARKVDDLNVMSGIILEEVYHSCYRWTSEFVHGVSGSSNSYFKEVEQGLIIDFGANFRDVDIVLPMASRMLIHMASIINHLYYLNIDLSKQFEKSGIHLNN